MTFVSERRLPPTPTARCNKGKLVYTMRCDICSNHFNRTVNLKVMRSRPNHYCSPKCFAEASQSGNFIDLKKRETSQRLHGVDYKFATFEVASSAGRDAWKDDARQKREKTLMKKYGVRTAFDIPAVRLSSETTFRTKPEIMLHEMLNKRFGENDIKTWVRVHGKCVDFHIKSIDTYVEMDGSYWHVLDEPIEVVEASTKQNDKMRAAKWHRDRWQDALFAEMGLRLVRISDTEVYRDGDRVLEKLTREHPVHEGRHS